MSLAPMSQGTIWTLRGLISNIPAELEEAAMVDGASRFHQGAAAGGVK